MGDRYVKTDVNENILYSDANIMYGYVLCESLPYDEGKFDRIVIKEDFLSALDDSDIGYFIEVDLSYPYKRREKRNIFHSSREKENWFL